MCMVRLIRASWDSWSIVDGLLDMYFTGDVGWACKDVVNLGMGMGNLGVQRTWSEIMNVLANLKGKCWALESEFLEA